MRRLNQREPSAKQTEANRRNAQRSTGPRTPKGKQQVRLNALKHGLHTDLSESGPAAPPPHFRALRAFSRAVESRRFMGSSLRAIREEANGLPTLCFA
jgi:hypothetical protein